MFPSSKTYQSVLFVKADSAIKSIDDIKPTTTIALGATRACLRTQSQRRIAAIISIAK